MHQARVVIPVISVLLLTGCAAEPIPVPTTTPTVSATASPTSTPTAVKTTSIVVLGDSLSSRSPRNCPGCTTYIDEYAAALQKTTGIPVVVHNDAQDDSLLSDVEKGLSRKAVADDLEGADVVILWVGYNDGPPWTENSACPLDVGSTAEQQAGAVEAYTDDCINATQRVYTERYSDLFDNISSLSPDATSRFALTIFNNWAENPAFASFPAERMSALLDRVRPIYDTLNNNICAVAPTTGFSCVDVYKAMNGPDGRSPVTAFVGSDFTHLSQHGHDTVANLLVEALH